MRAESGGGAGNWLQRSRTGARINLLENLVPPGLLKEHGLQLA
jgi:hypothetical protein